MNKYEVLSLLADLVRIRNEHERKVHAIIGRSASLGNIGEFIASQVFDIDLVVSGSQKSIDGIFNRPPLAGRSVNVKWSGTYDSLLNMCVADHPDYYLVFCGPPVKSLPGRRVRPWHIDRVFIFESVALCNAITARQIGIATSVKKDVWDANEIFPRSNSNVLELTDEQRTLLGLFRSSGNT